MEYGGTAHNRSVYAAPPVGGLASVRLGQPLRSFPRQPTPTFFCARETATRFLLSGWQNVASQRER
jgi:hypothetical protein